MELILGEFEPGMLGAHEVLFASHFEQGDKLLQETYLCWLYEKNPHGRALMVRAQENGQWIAFLAMIPVRLLRQGAEQLAYYVVNVLVHPEHQGRHLFGRLITEAVVHCKRVGAWLMGHPNAMALPSWKRARMQFRLPLQVRPIWPGMSWGISQGRHLHTVQDIDACLREVRQRGLLFGATQQWQPGCDAAYLAWRFINHPVHSYQIRCAWDRSALLCVTKRIKPGVHLLVEAWSTQPDWSGLRAVCPWLTIAAVTEQTRIDNPSTVAPFDLRKTLPFFCTTFSDTVTDKDLSALSLAASDF